MRRSTEITAGPAMAVDRRITFGSLVSSIPAANFLKSMRPRGQCWPKEGEATNQPSKHTEKHNRRPTSFGRVICWFIAGYPLIARTPQRRKLAQKSRDFQTRVRVAERRRR